LGKQRTYKPPERIDAARVNRWVGFSVIPGLVGTQNGS
jgi:hypothetical protein